MLHMSQKPFTKNLPPELGLDNCVTPKRHLKRGFLQNVTNANHGSNEFDTLERHIVVW